MTSSWLVAPTRYAALAPPQARIGMAVLALAVIACVELTLTAPAPPRDAAPRPAVRSPDRADVELYRQVTARVRSGQPYYPAAAAALRAGDYPLKPFVTFRLPTLAWLEARLPPAATLSLFVGLAAGTFVAWAVRLAPAFTRTPPRLIAAALVLAGMARFVQADLIVFHEVWASLLVALSLALRRPDRWGGSAALGLAAVLIRETAALYVLVMAAAALVERRWREAIGWGAVLGALSIALLLHARAVAAVVLPADPASPGWSGMHGLGLFVSAAVAATGLSLLPAAVAAPFVALAAFGWVGWRDPMAVRALGLLAAYALLIGAAARPDTWYWAMFAAVPLLPGLAFAPGALGDLLSAGRGQRAAA